MGMSLERMKNGFLEEKLQEEFWKPQLTKFSPEHIRLQKYFKCMKEDILKDYGWCQVIRRIDTYILRYDAGGIATVMKEETVSKEQAEKAMENQIAAEQVLIEVLKSKN